MNKTFCSKLKDHELRKDRIRLANFCLPLYKVVSYHLNFGIKQIRAQRKSTGDVFFVS